MLLQPGKKALKLMTTWPIIRQSRRDDKKPISYHDGFARWTSSLGAFITLLVRAMLGVAGVR
jgi:hypothetical protein